MIAIPKEPQALLAEIGSLAKEASTLLCNKDYLRSESGIADIEARILGVNARLEHLVEYGPEWVKTLASDGLELVRRARDEAATVRRAWLEADPSTGIARARELMKILGDVEFEGAPDEPDVLKMHADYAADYGARKLPHHGEVLSKWSAEIGSTALITAFNVDGAIPAEVSRAVPVCRKQKSILTHMLIEGFDSVVNVTARGEIRKACDLDDDVCKEAIDKLRKAGLLEPVGKGTRLKYYLSHLGCEVAGYIRQES